MQNDKTSDRLLSAQWVLERHLAWISAAETKVGAVITIDTGLLAGLAAAYGVSDASTRNALSYIIACIASACAIGAIYCGAMALKPRTGGPQSSLLFFGRVAEMDRLNYQTEFANATDWQRQLRAEANGGSIWD